MKIFKFSFLLAFVFIGVVVPLSKIEASNAFFYHTTLSDYEQYPALSNPGEFPVMYIKATISQAGNFCVQAQATADKDDINNYPWDDTIVSVNGGCLSSTDSATGHSYFGIDQYDGTFGPHLAQIKYKIGGRWKPIIIFNLLNGTRRYSELKKLIPAITEKMLIQHLKQLEADNLVIRKAYPVVPPFVEYSLTDSGKALNQVLGAMVAWADNNRTKSI